VRAIVVHEGGGPDVLELEEVPDPAASNGQVLVRVEAAAVNHCRHLGADVYATASSSKHDRLRELGAEPLAYDDERLPELHAEAVLDPVLGEGLEQSLAAFAPGGRLVTWGALDSPMVSVNMWTVVGNRLRIIGTSATSVTPEARSIDRTRGQGRAAWPRDRS
jgi:NADPH:quinone reductase-like Zn-dependent oxidoreductase